MCFLTLHSHARVRAHKSLVLRAKRIKRQRDSFLDSATVPRSERSRSFWTPLSAFAENRITRFAFAARRRQEMSIQSFTGNGHFPGAASTSRTTSATSRPISVQFDFIADANLKTNDCNVFLFRWTARRLEVIRDR